MLPPLQPRQPCTCTRMEAVELVCVASAGWSSDGASGGYESVHVQTGRLPGPPRTPHKKPFVIPPPAPATPPTTLNHTLRAPADDPSDTVDELRDGDENIRDEYRAWWTITRATRFPCCPPVPSFIERLPRDRRPVHHQLDRGTSDVLHGRISLSVLCWNPGPKNVEKRAAGP